MNVQIKELFGDSVAAAISEDMSLAPLPDSVERQRLAQVFPTHGRQCDIPVKIARTIAHFAPPASLFAEEKGGRNG